MKCYVCGGKGNLKHLDRNICKKCFLKNIEKRVKKHLGRKLFKKNDKILVVGEIEGFLLVKAIKDLPVKLTFRKKIPKNTNNFDWLVVGNAMDEINKNFLEELFKGKLKLSKPKRKIVNLLESLTEEEIKLYAKLRKISYSGKKSKGLLEKLKNYKELKYNLYKNIKELRKLKIK